MTDLEAIVRILPQTQCRQCGFDGCDAYASAILEGRAPINRCATGGRRGIARLAQALGVPPLELDAEYGQEMPFALAHVRPDDCIGCALCARACPVDAITGLPKALFSVLRHRCTGCALCVPACPVDAIDLQTVQDPWDETDARQARQAFLAKKERERRRKTELDISRRSSTQDKRALIDSLLRRVRNDNGDHP